MATLDGMTLDLAGAGTPDLLSGVRTVHTDGTWELYDNSYFNGDIGILVGVTVNLSTGDHQFVVQPFYGHKGSDPTTTGDTPARAAMTATFTWNSGGNTTTAMTVDTAAGTVYAGKGVPPLVFTWNSGSETVTTLFEGHAHAFTNTILWIRNPKQTSVSPPSYCVRYDPALEDTSFSIMFTCACYGGAWVDNADGKWVRADVLKFHTSNTGVWYRHGSNWWLSSANITNKSQSFYKPVTGEGDPPWNQKADRAHNDMGNLAFCQAFHFGDAAIQSNQAYHFLIKQIAARYLGHTPDPAAGYGHEYDSGNIQVQSMRAQGRPISTGAWIAQALFTMQSWRANDAEVTELFQAVSKVALGIFNRIWSYSKPRWTGGADPDLPWTIPSTGWFSRYTLPDEPKSLMGFWVRGNSDRLGHPEAGGSLPAGTRMNYREYFMGGLLWMGIFHLWERLEKLGLTHLPDYTRARILMDSIFLGVEDLDIEGLYNETYQWGDPSTIPTQGYAEPGHPFDPPSPLPPAYAQNGLCASSVTGATTTGGCWPNVGRYSIGGYEWCWEYWSIQGNDNNEDLRYQTGPSPNTFGQAIGMYEFAQREAMLSETKLSQIISDYSYKSYHWHIGTDSSATDWLFSENVMVETVDSDLRLEADLQLQTKSFRENNVMVETVDSVIRLGAVSLTLISPVDETNVIAETVARTVRMSNMINLRNEMVEKVISFSPTISTTLPPGVFNDTIVIGDVDDGGIELSPVLRRIFSNANAVISVSGNSVNITITGSAESKKAVLEVDNS